MVTNRTRVATSTLTQLLRSVSPECPGTDGERLRAFVERREPAAFAELVRRHGPMVLGVCLRVLRHRQDAEDAFQATFLVLARKAGTVSPPNAVGNWLYGVALQTAVRARASAMKRRGREVLVPQLPEPAVREPGWDDLAEVLDEELGRLPDHYRAVIVLCDVEGRAQADAARHLDCPEGSVWSRLSRARAMLAKRLTRRGVTLSTGALGLLIGQNATTAGVPAALAKCTLDAVGVGAVGSAVSGGTAPAVATLTEGVLRAMLVTKLKAATLSALVLGLVVLGGAAGFGRAGGQDPMKAGEPPAVKGATEADAPATKAPDEVDDATAIRGTWVVVEMSPTDAKATDEDRDFLKKGGVKFTFTADRVSWVVDKTSAAEGRSANYRLDPVRDPRRVEWTDKDDGQVVARGVYELKNDTLRLRLNMLDSSDGPPPQFPVDFDIKRAKPGGNSILLVLKREAAPRAPADSSKRSEPRPEQPEKRELPAAQKEFQSVWKLEFSSTGGSVRARTEADVRLTITNKHLVWQERGEDRVCTYRVDPEKSPMHIDLKSLVNGADEGKVTRCIYRIEDDVLTICEPADATSPRPTRFSTDGKPGAGHVITVYKRVKPEIRSDKSPSIRTEDEGATDPDPVAALRELVKQSEGANQTWVYEADDKKWYRAKVTARSVSVGDVTRTDSLITPFRGVIHWEGETTFSKPFATEAEASKAVLETVVAKDAGDWKGEFVFRDRRWHFVEAQYWQNFGPGSKLTTTKLSTPLSPTRLHPQYWRAVFENRTAPKLAGNEPLSPRSARLWEQWLKETPGTEVAGGYLAAGFESDGPKGELRLIPDQRNTSSLGGLKSNGGYRYIVSVAFTPKVRQQFQRIGIADLEAHLRGKNVRVTAKVATCWLADGKFPQMRLLVGDISQIDGIDAP